MQNCKHSLSHAFDFPTALSALELLRQGRGRHSCHMPRKLFAASLLESRVKTHRHGDAYIYIYIYIHIHTYTETHSSDHDA